MDIDKAQRTGDLGEQRTEEVLPPSTAVHAHGVRPYTQEEVIQLIHHWSEYFSVPVEHPLRIAKCESNYRFDARNKTSSAAGVFQYLSGSWANTFEGKAGASVFDANANITAAIRHMSIHGYDAWECK